MRSLEMAKAHNGKPWVGSPEIMCDCARDFVRVPKSSGNGISLRSGTIHNPWVVGSSLDPTEDFDSNLTVTAFSDYPCKRIPKEQTLLKTMVFLQTTSPTQRTI